MRIVNMLVEDRPQEKLLYSGAESLSTQELLALLIRTGTKEQSAVQLAEELLAVASNCGGLGQIDVKELLEVDGIGTSKACSVIAAIELGKRVAASRTEARSIIRDSTDAAQLLLAEFRDEKREHLVELMLNVKGEVEAKQIISIGELSATSVHPREVFAPAIRKSAAGIIVAHNHPSGDPTPSPEDIQATERLLEASKIIGIKLVDHLVLGYDSYVSLRAEGHIRN